MEFFKKFKAVKLVSCHDHYLFADDKEQVEQRPDGTSKNVQWDVELVEGDANAIRLKSCYGRYLTAADESFRCGVTREKVVKTGLETGQTKWIPEKDGSGVKLKTAEGKYLRANLPTSQWRNSVTHNVPFREKTQDFVVWKVEAVSKNQYKSAEYSLSKGEDEGESEKKAKGLNLLKNQSEAQEKGEPDKIAKGLNLLVNQSEAQEKGELEKKVKGLNPFGDQSEAQGNVTEEEEEEVEEEEEEEEEKKDE